MSDYFDEYGELELNEEVARLLDADPEIERPRRRGAAERGTEEYAKEYKAKLTKLWVDSPAKIKPYPWQLDAALASHLGLDVLIIAGTGFGKTWAFLLNCLDNKKLLVYIISPLNALANQQAKNFNDAGIKAVAVNSTTNYPGLYKEILRGQYQVVISSIEAFLDTTRLLPAVKSTELARTHSQMVVLDEAHCMRKWGPEFRPKYSSVGHLRLVLPPTTTFIAATATANEATRKEIKKQLRFGPDSYYINLGNHCPNLAYSIHRLVHGASSVYELLEYYPRTDCIEGITIVYVDSRQLGHTLLHVLRQHLDPEIRHEVEIYHSMRGEWDKAVIAYGFEKKNGYKTIFSTEALTMGLDFRKVTRVIQFLACSDLETGIQRGGRGGRDKNMECDVVFMVQDSLFDDSKEGQKRAAKEEQQTPTELAANMKAAASKGKGKSSAKTYSDSIRRFINAPGCLNEVIDKEFDNPPRGEEKCLCQYHKRLRGEPILREQMRAIKVELEKQGQTVDAVDHETHVDNNGDQVPDNTNTSTPGPAAPKMRAKAKAKPYKDALELWRDAKYNSDECRRWNIRKHWLLPDKILERLSKDPGITTVNHLNAVKPLWNYRHKWGAEVLYLLQELTNKLEAERIAQDEEKRHTREEKQRKAEESQRQSEAKRQETQKRRRIEDEQLQQSLAQASAPVHLSSQSTPAIAPDSDVNPRPAKRTRLPNLPKDATDEQKAERKQLLAANKRAKQRERYRLNKVKSEDIKQEVIDSSVPGTPLPGPSSASTREPIPGSSDPQTPQILNRVAKEELIDNSEQLLASGDEAESHKHPLVSRPMAPATPHTPVSLSANLHIPEIAQNQYPTPWSVSADVSAFSAAVPMDHSPSEVPRRRRPKPRPPPNQTNSPSTPPP